MVGGDETNFPHKLLLTKRQVENICKAFANKWSTDIKLPKTELSVSPADAVIRKKILGSDRHHFPPWLYQIIQH